jgi:hypothetical protein
LTGVVLSKEEQARTKPAMLWYGSIVPALTAFLIEQLQASQAWQMPNILGTPDILTAIINASTK